MGRKTGCMQGNMPLAAVVFAMCQGRKMPFVQETTWPIIIPYPAVPLLLLLLLLWQLFPCPYAINRLPATP